MAKCLYNGVELPELPEWDKENYPYATLHYIKGFKKYLLFVFPKTAYVFESNGSLFFGGKDDDDVLVDAYQYSCQPGGDSWGGPTYWEHANSFIATLDGSESVAFRDVWANFDVEYNGTLYLAASDPIPVSPVQIDPAALLETFFTGQAISRMRGVQPEKKLVGYLYGGVRPLPDINQVWTDKGTYPKAAISEEIADVFALIALNGEAYVTSDAAIFEANGEVQYGYWLCPMTEEAANLYEIPQGEWTLMGESIETNIRLAVGTPFWSNFDILTADGSSYLAASEPVPVYE